jgi:energy-coupling factor transporter transmembrane protein EcfT
LGSVLLGVLVAPGHAFEGGRLDGALWVIPPAQVAHYAAVVTGLVVVLWFCGHVNSRITLLVVAVVGTMLVLTRARTALIALVAGLLVAGLSLIVARARVRRLFAIAGVVTGVATITLSGFIVAFLARGESGEQLGSLTGRTAVWGLLLAFPRDPFQEVFGFGLSTASFNGLPIDSNWLSSYDEQGLFGVAVCAAMLLFLLIAAYFQERGVQRSLALFLVVYCLIASFTEDGFTDASPYLLDLTLAASLIVASAAGTRPP